MHDKGFITIVPAAVTQAFQDEREAHPEEADLLDRVQAQLEITRPLLSEIKEAVAEFYGLKSQEMLGRYRNLEIVIPRQICCYLAHRYTRQSMQSVGDWIGLHHTTVLHSVRKIERLVLTKPLVADDINLLQIRISEKMMRRRRSAC